MFALQTRDSEGLFRFEHSDANNKLLHSSFYYEVMINLKKYFDQRFNNEYQFIDNDMGDIDIDYVLLEDETDKFQQLKRHEKYLSVCYDYINKQKSIVQNLKF